MHTHTVTLSQLLSSLSLFFHPSVCLSFQSCLSVCLLDTCHSYFIAMTTICCRRRQESSSISVSQSHTHTHTNISLLFHCSSCRCKLHTVDDDAADAGLRPVDGDFVYFNKFYGLTWTVITAFVFLRHKNKRSVSW